MEAAAVVRADGGEPPGPSGGVARGRRLRYDRSVREGGDDAMATARNRTIEQIRKHDPFVTPDHRWESARAIVAEGRRAPARHDPPEVAEAVAYLSALDKARDDRGRNAVQERWPDL